MMTPLKGLALVFLVLLGAAPKAAPPNIVFVLTDDLAWNLVQYMPHVQDLQNRGMTFSRYFVTDSLCCPSRSSIFSGRYPHNTKIFTNKSPDGGFDEFHARGEEAKELMHKVLAKARRWVVERTHSWMNRFRGILIRWSKKPANYFAMLHMSFAFIIYHHMELFG